MFVKFATGETSSETSEGSLEHELTEDVGGVEDRRVSDDDADIVRLPTAVVVKITVWPNLTKMI